MILDIGFASGGVRALSTDSSGRSINRGSAVGGRTSCPYLRLHAVDQNVPNLGPGPAAVIWFQGCPIACPGCMSPETWSDTAGVLAKTQDVATWLESTDTHNLTLAGGEPAEQAAGVHALLDLLGPSWTVTLYSGRTFEELVHGDRPLVRALVERVDLAITGPYVRELHAPLLWRGSSNQRLVDITGRVVLPEFDRPAGVMVRLRRREVEVIGVPPEPGFVEKFRSASAAMGLDLRRPDEPPRFPFDVLFPTEV